MKIKGLGILVVINFAVVLSSNAQVINAGVGGNSTVNLLQRLESDVLQHKPDLVILMVGTNDMLNSKKMISYQLYKNNLNKILERIKENGANVLLMSSPPVDSVYLFDRHDKELFKEAPNVKLDSARHIVASLAYENDLEYLDLFQVFQDLKLPKHNEDKYFRNEKNSGAKDGVHPTSLGYRFIAETVFECLKEKRILEEHLKIICFGDSITYGSGVKNGGTVEGENYPAVLLSLIDSETKN